MNKKCLQNFHAAKMKKIARDLKIFVLNIFKSLLEKNQNFNAFLPSGKN